MRLSILTLSLMLGFLPATASQGKLRALIIDGQNNHVAWPKTTLMLQHYLEDSGLFEVSIARTRYTWRGTQREAEAYHRAGIAGTEDLPEPKADPDFKPNFHDFDVVISNFGARAAEWPDATQAAFVDYMYQGGGFVSVHAADNCFPNWPEYTRIIGLGGWGPGRSRSEGVMVYYNLAGELVRDATPAGAAHGAEHSFPITVRAPGHPIMQGLPRQWMVAQDECYARLRGPAEDLTVLATGKDVSARAVTDRHEPMLMAIEYGCGRTFHTTLGHDVPAFEDVGFIVTFLRGTEWAATGQVTQAVPDDFPTADQPRSREFVFEGLSSAK